MSCAACSAHVEKAVGELAGVEQVQVNLMANSMAVSFAEDTVNAQDIICLYTHLTLPTIA